MDQLEKHNIVLSFFNQNLNCVLKQKWKTLITNETQFRFDDITRILFLKEHGNFFVWIFIINSKYYISWNQIRSSGRSMINENFVYYINSNLFILLERYQRFSRTLIFNVDGFFVEKLKIKRAYRILRKHLHNWLYSPLCKDNTIGIVPRLLARKYITFFKIE